MEDKASEEELGNNQESDTVICGMGIKIYGKGEGKQQNLEQNKEDSEQMIKDKKQFEKNDRKDNDSGVSRNKDNENETNTHQKLKGVIQKGITSVKPVKRAVAKMKEVQMKYTKGMRREPTGRVKAIQQLQSK